VLNVRSDFPFTARRVNGRPLTYFDNAATTQKPRVVIDALVSLYGDGIANVHRAVNFLADDVTQQYEQAREIIASFIGAGTEQITFTANATHGINLVCASLAQKSPLKVVTTTLEHHSNMLPWRQHGDVVFAPWSDTGELDLEALNTIIQKERPSLVALSSASNFLGTLRPIKEIVRRCHERNVPVLIDASQSVAHESCDVAAVDCDYLVFSGHKVYGPGGIGVLYIKDAKNTGFAPTIFGGAMVKEVHEGSHVLADFPYRLEAGTPHIEGVIGLAAAVSYVESLGLVEIRAHEALLTERAKSALAATDATRLLGPPAGMPSAPIVAFELANLAPSSVAKILAERANVIVRSGFHCAQPAHDALKAGPTLRASFGVYNTVQEVELFVQTVRTLIRVTAA
jgi:cysteine desulfurase/selenocysteine lyase